MEATPAYNINKFRSPDVPFHPKGIGVGYILTIEGKRIYHTGDSDHIPEMSVAKGVDVALLPVSGTYVMTPEEAVEAARTIRPQLAIPMHFGTIVGSQAKAEIFQKASPCRVRPLHGRGEGFELRDCLLGALLHLGYGLTGVLTQSINLTERKQQRSEPTKA